MKHGGLPAKGVFFKERVMDKWPDKLFVVPEQDQDDTYWLAKESTDEHAEVGESVEVGIYQLVKTVTVKTAVLVG